MSFMAELGIDKSIFIKPKTFHLTVLMLKLYNKDQVDAAAEVLEVYFVKFILARLLYLIHIMFSCP